MPSPSVQLVPFEGRIVNSNPRSTWQRASREGCVRAPLGLTYVVVVQWFRHSRVFDATLRASLSSLMEHNMRYFMAALISYHES